MVVTEFESAIIITAQDSDQPTMNQRMGIVIMLISAFGTASRFIARTFLEQYAVVIQSTATAISFITSLRNLIQMAFQSSFGRLSDKLGRKTLIVVGTFGQALTLALIPFIRNGWLLVVGVATFSVFVALSTPAFTALLGDLTSHKSIAGLLRMVNLVGAIASLIALLSVGNLSNLGETELQQYSIILYAAAGLFFITGVISLFLINPSTEKLEKVSVLTFRPLRENKEFRRFVVFGSIMGFSMSLGWPIFPFVRTEFASPEENAWIWASFSVIMIITLIVIRPVINKMNRKWLLFIGRVIMFYIPLNLAITTFWVQTWWHMAIGSALSGFGNALYMIGESAYILDQATVKEKGTYTGLFYLFLGLATFAGSLISGVLADIFIPILGQWQTIGLFLFIIAGIRFISSFGFLFLRPSTR
ncbi:MAG: MFS transporter [Candidatus Heimdallarchaeota archaeon]|nr:MFS transporter [Candidatus Heimdallarchaeota archaeon]